MHEVIVQAISMKHGLAQAFDYFFSALSSTSALYVPAQEFCSLAHRIQILLKYSLAQRGLNLDPVFGKNDSEHHRTYIRTHACKEGTRYFLRDALRLSPRDLLAVRVAWRKEFESHAAQSRNRDSCSRVRNDLLISYGGDFAPRCAKSHRG